ncbi:MAG: hypothetical protein A2787_01935 [Omnitrophica WOR_2 bacterium RIFCSPHIGHO2_01_FULL_48_9]|nr:MAG: hypothetical protein A2787_01935 [Omnitrophica WOR_2 bacterium RIFCSPHIGHO2_01_FULL_48_9]
MSLLNIFFIFLLLFQFHCLPICANAENIQQYYEEAAQAYQAGDYQKAIALYEKVLELEPKFAPAYNALGVIYRNRSENILDSVWYFKEAIEADPNYLEAYDSLGKIYQQVNEPDLAIEYLKKALAINPDYLSAHFTVAWVYLLGKSQPQEAEYHFKKVIETKGLPLAYYGLGLAYSMNKNNAMVLDVVTQLREMGQNEYAAQLEQMIRKPFQPQEAQLVLPPGMPERQPNVLVESTPKPPPAPPSGGEISGYTQIRLRGKLTGIPVEIQPEKKR